MIKVIGFEFDINYGKFTSQMYQKWHEIRKYSKKTPKHSRKIENFQKRTCIFFKKTIFLTLNRPVSWKVEGIFQWNLIFLRKSRNGMGLNRILLRERFFSFSAI
jgi:hypothetical protein